MSLIVIDIPKEKYDRLMKQMQLDRNFSECKITPLPKGQEVQFTSLCEDCISRQTVMDIIDNAKGITDNDKVVMHGFDVKTSFRGKVV